MPKTTVLVAEDDYLVCEEIKRQLERAGFEVIADADDGQQAVELTARLHPDVIILDVQMPVLDGLTAARSIQASCPTPVVILTAYQDQSIVDEASRAGVGAYVTKPPQAEELNRAITIARARHQDLMEIRQLLETVQQQQQEIAQAFDEIKTLRGIVPICSVCKKVRDDDGYWHQVEEYVRDHSEADFSHGYCPDCLQRYLKDLKR